MALFVTETLERPLFEWHIGEKTTGMREIADRYYDTLCVQADGHELDAIRESMQMMVPDTLNNRVVRWYGDHARFILGNLTCELHSR